MSEADVFTDPIVLRLGVLPITRTMISSVLASALVLVVCIPLASFVRKRPEGRSAAFGRIVFRFIDELVSQSAGRSSPALVAFAGALFLFISAATLVGELPGLTAPTANLAATSALAALVFLVVPTAGIRARGFGGYLRHYLRPNPLLFPIHVVSELSRTLALALRLFGNMFSGHLLVALILALTGLLVPVPLMALDLLIGLLQAYIFTILACVYVGAAMQVGDES